MGRDYHAPRASWASAGECGSIGAAAPKPRREEPSCNSVRWKVGVACPRAGRYVEATSVAVDAQRQRVGVQPGRASGHHLRPRGQVPALVGRGPDPRAPTASHIGPDGTDLAHRRPASHHPAVHAGGQAAPDHRRSRPAVARCRAASRSTGRPTSALSPKTGDIYISDGYGNSQGAQVRSQGPAPACRGASRAPIPACFNIPHNIVTDAAGLVYVADRGELARADLRRRREVPRPVEQPASPVRALRRSAQRRLLRRRAADRPSRSARTCRTSALASPCSRSRASRSPAWAARFAGEKPGEFVAPHGVAVDSRGDFYVAEVSWTGAGQDENPRARSARCRSS